MSLSATVRTVDLFPAYSDSYAPGACGKTSLLCSFALGEFPKEYVCSTPPFVASSRTDHTRFLCSNRVSLASCTIRTTSLRPDASPSYLRELCCRDSVRWQGRSACTVGYRVSCSSPIVLLPTARPLCLPEPCDCPPQSCSLSHAANCRAIVGAVGYT